MNDDDDDAGNAVLKMVKSKIRKIVKVYFVLRFYRIFSFTNLLYMKIEIYTDLAFCRVTWKKVKLWNWMCVPNPKISKKTFLKVALLWLPIIEWNFRGDWKHFEKLKPEETFMFLTDSKYVADAINQNLDFGWIKRV